MQSQTSQEKISKWRQFPGAVWTDMKNIKWALLALLAYYVVTRLLFHEFCLMRIMTGFPCPGCGATRACMLLLHFRWREALKMNPAIFLWVPYILYLLWQRYFGEWNGNRKRILLGPVCLITIILFVWGMGSSFPTEEPYTYFEGNLLKRCYPFLFR